MFVKVLKFIYCLQNKSELIGSLIALHKPMDNCIVRTFVLGTISKGCICFIWLNTYNVSFKQSTAIYNNEAHWLISAADPGIFKLEQGFPWSEGDCIVPAGSPLVSSKKSAGVVHGSKVHGNKLLNFRDNGVKQIL